MIWKRIEIVSCVVMAVSMSLPAFAGPSLPGGQPVYAVRNAQGARVESFPVRVPAPDPATPLESANFGNEAQVEGARQDAGDAQDEGQTALLLEGQPPGEGEILEEGETREYQDVPLDYFWTRHDGVRMRTLAYLERRQLSRNSPGLLASMARSGAGSSAFPKAGGGLGGWSLGTDNWNTRLDDFTELRLGSSNVGLPAWSDGMSLGGVSFKQAFSVDAGQGTQWQYAVALGAANLSDSGAPGDLVMGPVAGSIAMSYDYSSSVRLASHTEMAADLLMSGMMGQYDLGALGRWSSGVARSQMGTHEGWRYRAMADIDLASDVRLAWEGERHSQGYADIRRYALGSPAAGGGRQRWAASWDAGRWGRWSGSVESVYGRYGLQARHFGIGQQFLYSPNLQIGLRAEREVVGGDYDIGLSFTFTLN